MARHACEVPDTSIGYARVKAGSLTYEINLSKETQRLHSLIEEAGLEFLATIARAQGVANG